LSDQIPAGDAYSCQLVRLAKELEYENQSTQASTQFMLSLDHTSNWAKRIPGLSYEAQEKLIDLIVNGALRVNRDKENLAPPIHALRLARGFLAACSGCWKEYNNGKLKVSDLEKIIDLYWRGER
jgi:hypothetical protein